MTLTILFSLKSVESLENGLQTQSGVTPLFSMSTELQASSLSRHSVDARCKWVLTYKPIYLRPSLLNSMAVADLYSKILDAPGVQILSISCSFWEYLAKSYAPPRIGGPISGKSCMHPLYQQHGYPSQIKFIIEI